MVTIKSKREIELMREAGRVTALTHKAIEEAIKPGMTTADIDRIAEETMKKYGAVSAEKGYDPGIRGVPPYPAATCISINDEVIHGVPSKKRVIKDGDIVSVDLVELKNGYNFRCEVNINAHEMGRVCGVEFDVSCFLSKTE